MREILISKRFWIAIAGVISAVLNDQLPITEEQLQQILLMLAAWIIGDSLRPTTKK